MLARARTGGTVGGRGRGGRPPACDLSPYGSVGRHYVYSGARRKGCKERGVCGDAIVFGAPLASGLLLQSTARLQCVGPMLGDSVICNRRIFKNGRRLIGPSLHTVGMCLDVACRWGGACRLVTSSMLGTAGRSGCLGVELAKSQRQWRGGLVCRVSGEFIAFEERQKILPFQTIPDIGRQQSLREAVPTDKSADKQISPSGALH